MKCLSCDGDLAATHSGGIRVEQCADCGGLWLDQGELDRIVETERADARWMDLDLWRDTEAVQGQPSARACPYGHGPLATLTYGESGIEVDVCPTCGGVWLDTGELEKILAYLSKRATSLSLPGYIAESLRGARDLIAGEESLVTEWKDFRAVLRMLRLRLAVDHPTIAAILRSLPR